jgi:cysteine synthase A
MQADGLGGDLRKALHALTSQRTIPQIFIGGQHIGGCTDLFDGWKAGRLQGEMDAAGIAFSRDTLDPYSFLPGWLHARG